MEDFDPFAMMWTDPKTCAAYFANLPEEEQNMVAKVAADFSRSLVNSMDALMGKDQHGPARIALLMAANVAAQAEMLTHFGFELDEDGSPVEDEDEHETDDDLDVDVEDITSE